MIEILTIAREDVIQHIKLSCQIPAVIDAIATRRLIVDAAADAQIHVDAEELQKAADSLRLANNLLQAEDTWAWLQQYHLSLDEFEEIAYTNLLSTKLAQHLFADQVEPFFLERQLDYTGAVLYEVVLDDADLAMEVFYALQEGETSFFEVARQYIQDTELRRMGGYRGKVLRSALKPEISAAVFAAQPPQFLRPIVTHQGVHLILVEEIVLPELDEPMRVTILADLFNDWLKQRLEQVEIIAHFEPLDLASPPGNLPVPHSFRLTEALAA